MSNPPPIPASKIKMMRASIRCLGFGLASFLPVIGFPCALIALWYSGSARRLEKTFWNPARPHRIWGSVCAFGSAMIWLTLIGLIIWRILDPPSDSYD
jgi:hypothetical protein